MGNFSDLTETVKRLEYERGYRDGYLIETERERFLRYTTIKQINGRIWGWLVRKQYNKLFNNV